MISCFFLEDAQSCPSRDQLAYYHPTGRYKTTKLTASVTPQAPCITAASRHAEEATSDWVPSAFFGRSAPARKSAYYRNRFLYGLRSGSRCLSTSSQAPRNEFTARGLVSCSHQREMLRKPWMDLAVIYDTHYVTFVGCPRAVVVREGWACSSLSYRLPPRERTSVSNCGFWITFCRP